jgi:polyisoprenoid-binding protein YceI
MKMIASGIRTLLLLVLTAAPAPVPAQMQEVVLDFVPAQTTVHYTVEATLHSVHGSFDLKRGQVHFNPSTGAISGEIVVDATTGQSGNDGRDRKMHTQVLESTRYSEIVFRPDRIEGSIAQQGPSTIQVHGTFSIHGEAHQITVPVEAGLAPNSWTATARFTVPYVKWGLKNPSTFILHVSETVDLEVQASGPTR